MVEVNGRKYLDGGLSDAIPLERSIMSGNAKNLVILTKEVGYVRTPISSKELALLKLRYASYPNVWKLMRNRDIRYNDQLAFVEKMEKEHQKLLDKVDELDRLVSETLEAWEAARDGEEAESAAADAEPVEVKTD